MLNDLRHGLRTLARQPGFTLAAIATLALGIACNSAVFSVVNAVLLRPLPYGAPERLAVVWESVPRMGQERNIVSPPNYMDWARENASFESMAAYTEAFLNVASDGGEPERVAGVIATTSFFDTLRVSPALGRAFPPRDPQARAAAEISPAVISHDLWVRRFGGDPRALGQRIDLNGGRAEIVGVLPKDFLFSGKRVDVFLRLGLPSRDDLAAWRGRRYLTVVGRLREGVTFEQAKVDMSRVARGLAERYPETNAGSDANVVSLQDETLGAIQPALWLLQASVAFVLLIAAANVAILQVARSLRRLPEFATRTALGATRGRLVRQLCVEGLLLTTAGAVFGVLAAVGGVRVLVALSPVNLPRAEQASLDPRVLLLTLAAAFASGLVSGLLPSLVATRRDLRGELQSGGKATGLASRSLGQRALVAGQVTVSLILLVGAALTARSFALLQSVDPGFVREGALVGDVSLPRGYATPESRAAFFADLLSRVEAQSGVRSAGVTDNLPLSGEDSSRRVRVLGAEGPAGAARPAAEHRRVSPHYFDSMGIRLLRGRAFAPGDDARSAGVVVVNQAFAERFLHGADPLGRQLEIEDGPLRLREVVGVVADVKHFDLAAVARPEMYVPFFDRPYPNVALVVRAADGVPPPALTAGLRRALAGIDASIPLANVKAIDAHVAAASARQRFSARVMGLFAAIALGLAALGLYGVVAYAVAQRQPEIGLRMALGADRPAIARLILGEGARLAGAGIVLGLAGAMALTRVIASQLYEVAPNDPASFTAAAAALAIATLAASAIPALRASRVNPASSLR